METRTILVVAALIVASVAVGSAAFTSGEVERTASVQVVGDANAVTGLQPGSTPVVTTSTGDQLQIDFSEYSNAEGINGNATYTIGNHSAPNSTYAFNLTNNGDSEHDYKFEYNFTNTPPTDSSVTFTAYDESETEIAQATDSNPAQMTLPTTETAYVVIEVDSSSADANTDDLSGTLNITAT